MLNFLHKFGKSLSLVLNEVFYFILVLIFKFNNQVAILLLHYVLQDLNSFFL